MTYKHTTKSGAKIALKDLEDRHLDNIISYIEKRASKGVTVASGGGFGSDMWYDEEVYYGKEAKSLLNYDKYIGERNRRNKPVSISDSDIATIEAMHDLLLDVHGYSLNSLLLTRARELTNKMHSIIGK